MLLVAGILFLAGLLMFGVAILIDLRRRKPPKIVVRDTTVEDRARTLQGP